VIITHGVRLRLSAVAYSITEIQVVLAVVLRYSCEVMESLMTLVLSYVCPLHTVLAYVGDVPQWDVLDGYLVFYLGRKVLVSLLDTVFAALLIERAGCLTPTL
jgi:hypothetical protein